MGAQAEKLDSENRELVQAGVQQLGAGMESRWPQFPRLASSRRLGVRDEQKEWGAGRGQREGDEWERPRSPSQVKGFYPRVGTQEVDSGES